MSLIKFWKSFFAPVMLYTGGGGSSGGGGSTPAATSQTQTVSSIAPWAQPGVSNLINQQMANMFPNQTTNADGSINLGQQAGYTAFGQNGAGIGPNQMNAAQSAVAGFSPLQQQAQQGVANMQMPGQFADATAMAGAAGQGLYGTANTANQYGNLGAGYGQSGAQIGTQGGLGYGQMGAGYGQQAAGQAGNAIGIGQMGVQAGQAGAGYGAMGAQQGASYGQNAQNAQAVQGYMNPYLQATLAPAMQLQNQQFGMINAQNQGQATQQGAFGGGRQAVTQGLNQQNQMLAQNQLTSNAYNQAYNVANQNMQQAANLGMQGAGLGIQGQNAAITGANTGLAGMNAANALYNTGIAGANTGLQGVNTALAGTAQGMKGAEVGLQGVNAAQAGYTGAGNQATNLGNLGTQQQAAQLGIYNAQNALGKEQQGNQQAVINQAIQNYANTQNYPMQQAYNLEGLYTGAPTAQTQTQYLAPPSAVNTAANAAVGTYAASKLVAKGGLMKTKEYAAGGQVAFDVGGAVESDLYNMDDTHLMQEAKSSPSMEIRKDAMRILSERQMEKQAMNRGVGAAPAAQGMQMAGGGIVAFTEGGSFEEKLAELEKDKGETETPKSGLFKRALPGSFSLPKVGNFQTNLEQYIPEDESKRGRVTADQLNYNVGIPGAGAPPAAPIDVPTSKGLSVTPQARSTTTDRAAPTDSNALSNVENYIKKLEAMGYGVPTEERKAMAEQFKADREEAKAQKKEDFMMGLLGAAGKGMSATSPFANVGIGQTMQGVAEGAAYANKNYNEALKAAQSGQLDLAKLNNTDRTNLLHYAVTGAVSDSNTRTKMAELAEIAKARASAAGSTANREALLDKRLLAQEIMKLQADVRYMDKSPLEIRAIAKQSLAMDDGANPVQLDKSQLALLNKYK